MYLLTQILLLLLCILMFKLPRDYKCAVLLLSVICFESVILSFVPFGKAQYVLPHCFIISELPYIFRHIKELRRTILGILMAVVIVAAIVLLVNSPHYNGNLTDTVRLFILELTGKYFAICYAFVCISSEKSMKPLLKISYYGLLVLTFAGIINLQTGRSAFIDAIGANMTVADNLQDLGGKYTYSERFRVQSLFFNPFNYGFICILILLLQIWGYLKQLVARHQLLISIFCSLFGVIFCGCRTNMLCCFVGVSAFLFFAFSTIRWMRYAVLGVILFVFSYSVIPIVQESVDQVLTVFDVNSSYSGSSLEMRITQYTAVLYHIQGYELFGRGLGFFNIDMGWGDGQLSTLADKDLWGLEGVVMSYLLERGYVGLLLYSVFYISLLVFVFRNRKIDKLTSAFCLGVLFSYLAFANMTGELNSVYPTLLLAGCCLKLLFVSKEMQTNS